MIDCESCGEFWSKKKRKWLQRWGRKLIDTADPSISDQLLVTIRLSVEVSSVRTRTAKMATDLLQCIETVKDENEKRIIAIVSVPVVVNERKLKKVLCCRSNGGLVPTCRPRRKLSKSRREVYKTKVTPIAGRVAIEMKRVRDDYYANSKGSKQVVYRTRMTARMTAIMTAKEFKSFFDS